MRFVLSDVVRTRWSFQACFTSSSSFRHTGWVRRAHCWTSCHSVHFFFNLFVLSFLLRDWAMMPAAWASCAPYFPPRILSSLFEQRISVDNCHDMSASGQDCFSNLDELVHIAFLYSTRSAQLVYLLSNVASTVVDPVFGRHVVVHIVETCGCAYSVAGFQYPSSSRELKFSRSCYLPTLLTI